MVSFRHFLLFSAISISLGEEVNVQARPAQVVEAEASQDKSPAKLAAKDLEKKPEEEVKPAEEPAANAEEEAGRKRIMEPLGKLAEEAKDKEAGEEPAEEGAKDVETKPDEEATPVEDAKKDSPALEEMAADLKEMAAVASLASEEVASVPKEDESGAGMPSAPQEDEVGGFKLAQVWHLAALLSFVGIACCSLAKVFQRPKKGQGKSVATSGHDDFEDLEGATNVAPTLPKRRSAAALLEAPQTPPKAKSDDGWGDDAWGNDSWDDLDDCEAELNTMDVAFPSVALPSAPAPPVKKRGKAD